MKVNDEFEALKSELSIYCIYGGMPYAPQGQICCEVYLVIITL